MGLRARGVLPPEEVLGVTSVTPSVSMHVRMEWNGPEASTFGLVRTP